MKKIFFVGGGTAGPVTPLLAVLEIMRSDSKNFLALWIGTKTGPERILARSAGIPFYSLSSGKWRRYVSIKNLTDIFRTIFGLFQSLFLIVRHRPSLIVSAGGYTAVPVAFAGFLCGIPIITHQQDVIPGLANRIIAPFAKRITVAFPESKRFFPKKKTRMIGNPARPSLLSGTPESARKRFGLEEGVPVLFVLGGGTGARGLNVLIEENAEKLSKFCQIIHLVGAGKGKGRNAGRYHAYEFFREEMADAYAVANLVVCRAGLGTLSELALLHKPAILIPLPDSHQEANARAFQDRGAARIFSERDARSQNFSDFIFSLLQDQETLRSMADRVGKIFPRNSAEMFADEIRLLAGLQTEER